MPQAISHFPGSECSTATGIFSSARIKKLPSKSMIRRSERLDGRFSVGSPVSYTHLTLPTICSV
eukprot:1224572-Alexandrium_andersonii.AAC.1